VLAALLALPAVAAETAKGPSDDFAVLAYMRSVAWRTSARACERGLPGYRSQFDSAYASWEKKNADTLKRGARLFQRAKNQEWKGIPATRVEANEVALAENVLKKPPEDTSPLPLNAEQRTNCDQLILDLSKGI
jgi:hypothetical protein